jgi:hypothetical protein
VIVHPIVERKFRDMLEDSLASRLAERRQLSQRRRSERPASPWAQASMSLRTLSPLSRRAETARTKLFSDEKEPLAMFSPEFFSLVYTEQKQDRATGTTEQQRRVLLAPRSRDSSPRHGGTPSPTLVLPIW